jgi:hypothetical protein
MYSPFQILYLKEKVKKMKRGFTIVILGRIADALETDIAELFTPIEKGKK